MSSNEPRRYCNCIIITRINDPECTTRDLEDSFSYFGRLTSISVKNKMWVIHFDDRKPRDKALEYYKDSKHYDIESLN